MRTPATHLHLIEPTVDLEASHRSFVAEMRAAGEELIPWVLAFPSESFAEYVAQLRDAARGIGIAEGKVPHATYWLVETRDDGLREIVAVANVRFELNETLLSHGGHVGYGVRPSARRRGFATTILRLALTELQARGIDRVLVTCDPSNTGSAKAIGRNGGVLAKTEFIPELGRVVARYWIDLIPATAHSAP
jgi:predicted acetyltransferase